jgi:DNA mismatch repair protein MutS
MMQQYRRVKHQIPPDALLLFRLGDFYEMFFDDAKTGSQLLNLALTNRNGVPMCGIPHHAAETYIGKLLRQGRKVAICDQLEEATPGKLVNRDVTQILSPGTHFDAHLLHAERNNFLAAICRGEKFGLALVDLTTGDFKVTELSSTEQLHNELTRTRPAEIIVPAEWFEEAKSLLAALALPITPHDGWTFERETAFFTLRDHFKTQSLDGFGAGALTVGVGAAGAALHYLQQSLRRSTSHIHRLTVYSVSDFMVLDATTQRNLELLESARSDRRHTLIGCMDRTLTPMGARLLREWLTRPLKDVAQIHARQDVIATFCDAPNVLADFREQRARSCGAQGITCRRAEIERDAPTDIGGSRSRAAVVRIGQAGAWPSRFTRAARFPNHRASRSRRSHRPCDCRRAAAGVEGRRANQDGIPCGIGRTAAGGDRWQGVDCGVATEGD